MSFVSKKAALMNIKQYHIEHGYTFVVVESMSDRYVAKCTNYGNGCQWRIRVAFSKVGQHWEIKNIETPHKCFSTIISQDRHNLDLSQIATIVLHSVKKNPSIPIESLIVEITSRHNYSITYRKACLTKQKALAMEFGN